MMPGTTPTHYFELPFDTSNVYQVRIIYKQDNEIIIKKTQDDCILDGSTIELTLTQEDTVKIDHEKPVDIQVRVLDNVGHALGSLVMSVGAEKCLDLEVLK